MKNILVVTQQEQTYTMALIPEDKLSKYNLEEINGKSVFDIEEEYAEQIVEIYKRLGLDQIEEHEKLTVDLKEYVNPQPPFTVDRLIMLDWSM